MKLNAYKYLHYLQVTSTLERLTQLWTAVIIEDTEVMSSFVDSNHLKRSLKFYIYTEVTYGAF